MNRGIISKIFDWMVHPTFDTDQSPSMWIGGLVIVLVLAFLWTRVVKQVVDAEL